MKVDMEKIDLYKNKKVLLEIIKVHNKVEKIIVVLNS